MRLLLPYEARMLGNHVLRDAAIALYHESHGHLRHAERCPQREIRCPENGHVSMTLRDNSSDEDAMTTDGSKRTLVENIRSEGDPSPRQSYGTPRSRDS